MAAQAARQHGVIPDVLPESTNPTVELKVRHLARRRPRLPGSPRQRRSRIQNQASGPSNLPLAQQISYNEHKVDHGNVLTPTIVRRGRSPRLARPGPPAARLG